MEIDVPALLVRVPRTAAASSTDDELYEAARKAWKVGAIRRGGGPAAPRVAFAVVKGWIAAGWTIDSWESHASRWAFIGSELPHDLQHHIGTDVRHLFPNGAANPMRYVGPNPSGGEAIVHPHAPGAVDASPVTRQAARAAPEIAAALHRISEAAFAEQSIAEGKYPDNVTSRSRPIAWFGDTSAYLASDLRIMTVGLNPSQIEFPEQNPNLRFPTGAGSKGADTCYVKSLDDYFRVVPYKKWFDTYRCLLQGLDASFYGDSALPRRAVHTDLCSPVPTSPTWSKLPTPVKTSLGSTGVPLWHDTVRALLPHVALVSVAWRHMAKIDFPPLSEWSVVHVVPHKKPYEVRVRRFDVDGHPLLVVWGQAGRTPFQLINNDERFKVGQVVSRLLASQASKTESADVAR